METKREATTTTSRKTIETIPETERCLFVENELLSSIHTTTSNTGKATSRDSTSSTTSTMTGQRRRFDMSNVMNNNSSSTNMHDDTTTEAASSVISLEEDSSSSKGIYYFGYGPICNELVRRRREIEIADIQAAYIQDYRLTFAFGGVANILPRVGFEVHGLLMKLNSVEDWEKMLKYEAGNTPKIRAVVPYADNDAAKDNSQQDAEVDSEDESHNADFDFHAKEAQNVVQAYLIEFPDDVDDTLLDAPIERLPQERYLKLIAQGMRQHGVNEDYITDEIEACPFIPNRKPEEYIKFPVAKKVKTISLSKYQKLCSRADAEGDLYFVLGRQVFRLGLHDPANPLAKWIEVHGHGKTDCTYMVHLTVVDPVIPFLDDPSQVTSLHIAWAENHLVEVVEQFGMSATRVYTLAESKDEALLADSTELSQETAASTSSSEPKLRRWSTGNPKIWLQKMLPNKQGRGVTGPSRRQSRRTSDKGRRLGILMEK